MLTIEFKPQVIDPNVQISDPFHTYVIMVGVHQPLKSLKTIIIESQNKYTTFGD
jgi:hypothetical protein